MYVPTHFEVNDKTVLHDVITRYPLGTWIVSNSADLDINHIPFLFDAARGTHGMLTGHVARANPVWRQLKDGTSSAIVFHAEQGYVSPNWYPGKQHDPGVVPTWNYAVVHVHGRAHAIEDKAWLLQHVTALTSYHETHRDQPWHVSDAPEEYIEKRLTGIVGIEISIESLTGKFKLSQNRSDKDQQGVITGLQSKGDSGELALAKRMQR